MSNCYWASVAPWVNCVDVETEILTARGWLSSIEVREGDETLSINSETGLAEWDSVQAVHQSSDGPFEMITAERPGLSFVATPDHRWLCHVSDKAGYNSRVQSGWRWKTTATISAVDRVPRAAPCADVPIEPKYTDAFVELVAWIWTEGHVASGDSLGLIISQSVKTNPENVTRIRRALQALCPDPKRGGFTSAAPYWSQRRGVTDDMVNFFIGAILAEEFLTVFETSHKQVRPEFIRDLTIGQLALFTECSLLGDGSCSSSGQRILWQSELDRTFAFQLACLLQGIPISLHQGDNCGPFISILKTTMTHPKGTTNQQHRYPWGKSIVNYIWCVTTRNGNWLARRNGTVYFTGNSGYGQQTAIQTQMIAREHSVRVGAISGLQGTPTPWRSTDNGPAIEVWPMRDSLDFIEHYVQFEADFAITLFDLWAEASEAPDMFKYVRQAPVKIAAWMPIDVEPLGKPDFLKLKELEGIVTPIAMSRHGMRMLKDAGFDPLYIPHSIDTQVFGPASKPGRLQCRSSLGLDPDEFIIGINAFNTIRKCWFEQLSAFAIFHKKHPDSRLVIHSVEQRSGDDSVNLLILIDHLGLGDCVGFSDQFGYRHGLLTPDYLCKWYNAIDVMSVASMGEGFGIPYIEAQACGTPAIGTKTAAAPELLQATGWLVEGQPYWSAYHNAEMKIPDSYELADAYEKAYNERKDPAKDHGVTQWEARQKMVREFARRYDKESVYDKFWRPALAHLGARNG